jgi:sigma-B regulation protein RsbU (phosphoserine phosphatase)
MDSAMPTTPKLSANSEESLAIRYQRIELELNAILEITRAINNNASEESLYMMYKFTLRGNLNIEKLALFVWDEKWHCKVSFGHSKAFIGAVLETQALREVKEITQTEGLNFDNEAFKEFEIVIPVFHKDNILAYVFLNKYHTALNGENPTTHEVDTRFVQTLSNIIIVAIENKKLVRKQIKQEAFKKEMEIAKSVQSLLFPKKLPYGKELQIKATYFPHDLIGGDYYDYIPLSYTQFILCVGDVSGKGVPAALLMSNFQACLRTLVRQTNNLKQIVEELNYLIYDTARGEHFITFFICLYDKAKHTLTYINAGHNPAFLYDFNTNQSQMLESGTIVLGSLRPLPFLIETTLNNLKNFFLFNYTDGVTEVINPEQEQFGIDRLIEFLKSRKKVELSEIHGQLVSRISNFKKEMAFVDDITLLSCRVEDV